MGLFSSKKKISVATSVVRALDDAQLPETAKTSVIGAIIGGGSISDELLEGLVNSIGVKADRAYEWAAREGYAYGLPKSTLVSRIQGKDVVRQVIERELGWSITFDYYDYGPINSIHVGWLTLLNSYRYDHATNTIGTLSTQLGTPVYLKDMVPVYTQTTVDMADPGELDPLGTPATAGYTPARKAQVALGLTGLVAHTPYTVDAAAAEDRVDVIYVYEQAGQLVEGTLALSLDAYDSEEADYHQARYFYTEGGVQRMGCWTYLDGSNQYSEIEAIFTTDYAALGTYFPIMYFRLNGLNLAQYGSHMTQAYKDSQKLGKYLGMDYQTVADAVTDNPDIDDVEQAMMIMAVSAKGESEVELRYLFDYFNTLYFNSASPYQANPSFLQQYAEYTPKAGQAVVFQDNAFKFSLTYRGIGKRRVAGNIGAVGTHAGGTTSLQGANARYYRRQINATFYEEVTVIEPQLTYHIYGKYSATGGYDSDTLLIPVDRAITDLFPIQEREKLYSRSLHYVFNSKVETKTKWYQSSAFRFVLIVVMIIITIYTAGATLKGLIAAAAISATALAIAVISKIVVAMAINYALKLFVKEVGPEVAFIVAVIAVAVGGAMYVAGTSANTALWAERLISVGNGLSSNVQTETQRLISGYESESQEFLLTSEAMTEELRAVQKQLESGISIDPFEFIGRSPKIVFGESPDDFYSRTVHSGNIGVVGIDAISAYVGLALTLPDVHDTAGDMAFV